MDERTEELGLLLDRGGLTADQAAKFDISTFDDNTLADGLDRVLGPETFVKWMSIQRVVGEEVPPFFNAVSDPLKELFVVDTPVPIIGMPTRWVRTQPPAPYERYGAKR